jgi:hypothetical protein
MVWLVSLWEEENIQVDAHIITYIIFVTLFKKNRKHTHMYIGGVRPIIFITWSLLNMMVTDQSINQSADQLVLLYI